MAGTRVLLVQCCHIPQWIHVWRRLAELHPDWEIEALALDHPHVRFYADRLAPGPGVHYLSGSLSLAGYDLIVFPLLNRGYRKVKEAAWRLGGERREVDYGGNLRHLDRAGLLRSLAHPFHQPDGAFTSFLESFPHRPLGEKILFVESASPGSIRRAEADLGKLMPDEAEVTRVGGESLARLWRRLRRKNFDGAVVFLTGEPGYFGLKLLPLLLRIPKVLAVNENGAYFYVDRRSLAGFLVRRLLRGAGYEPREPRILLVQTEAPDYVLACAERLRRMDRFRDSQVLLLCREEDRVPLEGAAVDKIENFPRSPRPLELWRLRRTIRRFDPDVNCAVFSGRPVFRKQKLLCLAFGARRTLAFNARLDSYWLTPLTAARTLRREPLLFEPDPVRITLFQTESTEYMREACRRLREPGRFPGARIRIVCRADDADQLRDLEGVEDILPYASGWSLSEAHRLWRGVRRFESDLRCAVFSGRPVFRRPKLLFLVSGLRRGLVLNARLDGYWLTPLTLPRIFRKEPLLFGQPHSDAARVLLIETEGPEIMKRALDTVRRPHVVPDARITLFCREDRAELYVDEEGLERIVTYSKRAVVRDLLQIWSLARSRPAIVAAVFSGRRVFLKQKLLFWLTPARHRLAFNENVDCFFVRWSNLKFLFGRSAESSISSLRYFGLTALKGFLFLPRFLFLLAWAAAAKGRRRRVLASEARRGRRAAASRQRPAGSGQAS